MATIEIDIEEPSENVYMVKRTSLCGSPQESPHPLAYRSPYVYTDKRLDSYSPPNDWFASGWDHTKEGSYFSKKIILTDWFIEINDLVSFIKDNNRIVLMRSPTHDFNIVEIYDDDRE